MVICKSMFNSLQLTLCCPIYQYGKFYPKKVIQKLNRPGLTLWSGPTSPILQPQVVQHIFYEPPNNILPMHHPCTHPCTDPCTAHLAGQPNPHSPRTGNIRTGTTQYCCSIKGFFQKFVWNTLNFHNDNHININYTHFTWHSASAFR